MLKVPVLKDKCVCVVCIFLVVKFLFHAYTSYNLNYGDRPGLFIIQLNYFED